jgi:uncharacterized protein YndB with AHSA1/START domain
MFTGGLDAPIASVAARALDIAAGRADALSGRYIPLMEPLTDLVTNAATIQSDRLYSLRIARVRQLAPNAMLAAVRARGEMASPNVVRLRRRLRITRRQAFDLWRDGETVASWFMPTDATLIGRPVFERKAGGHFAISLTSNGDSFAISGTVIAADADAGIDLAWNWKSTSRVVASGDHTMVEIDLVEVRGGVDVVVTHEGLRNDTVRDAYIRGWRRCLDGMQRVSESLSNLATHGP